MVRVTGLEWDSFVKGMAVGKGPGRFMVATRARRRAKAEREKSELPFQGKGVRFICPSVSHHGARPNRCKETRAGGPSESPQS